MEHSIQQIYHTHYAEHNRQQAITDAQSSMCVAIADRIVAARERAVTTGDPGAVAYIETYGELRPFGYATPIRTIIHAREQQYTYALNRPLEHPEYGSVVMIVLWSVRFDVTGPQTYVFVADANGHPVPESPRLFHISGANIARALAYLGYTATHAVGDYATILATDCDGSC